MLRFTYQWATRMDSGSFTVDEHSECIANVEAKLTVQRLCNPADLVAFDLVARGPAS
jgi:hypothetical protein